MPKTFSNRHNDFFPINGEGRHVLGQIGLTRVLELHPNFRTASRSSLIPSALERSISAPNRHGECSPFQLVRQNLLQEVRVCGEVIGKELQLSYSLLSVSTEHRLQQQQSWYFIIRCFVLLQLHTGNVEVYIIKVSNISLLPTPFQICNCIFGLQFCLFTFN